MAGMVEKINRNIAIAQISQPEMSVDEHNSISEKILRDNIKNLQREISQFLADYNKEAEELKEGEKKYFTFNKFKALHMRSSQENKIFMEEQYGDDYAYQNGLMCELMDLVWNLHQLIKSKKRNEWWNVDIIGLSGSAGINVYEKYSSGTLNDIAVKAACLAFSWMPIVNGLFFMSFYHNSLLETDNGIDGFSDDFEYTMEIDWSDPDSKAAKSFQEKLNTDFDEEYETLIDNKVKENLSMIKGASPPNNQQPRNLISIHKESRASLRFWEREYIEERFRIDTAWRLYIALTNTLPVYAIFDEKNHLRDTVHRLVETVASINNSEMRSILIELIYIRFKVFELDCPDISINDYLCTTIQQCEDFRDFAALWETCLDEVYTYQLTGVVLIDMLSLIEDVEETGVRQTKIRPLDDVYSDLRTIEIIEESIRTMTELFLPDCADQTPEDVSRYSKYIRGTELEKLAKEITYEMISEEINKRKDSKKGYSVEKAQSYLRWKIDKLISLHVDEKNINCYIRSILEQLSGNLGDYSLFQTNLKAIEEKGPNAQFPSIFSKIWQLCYEQVKKIQ